MKRIVPAAFAAVALLATHPAMAQSRNGLEGTLVVSATGGAFGKALQDYFYAPFQQATGVHVVRVDTELPEQFGANRAMLRDRFTTWLAK